MDKVFVLRSTKNNHEFLIKASSILAYNYREENGLKTIGIYTNRTEFNFDTRNQKLDWDNWDEFILSIRKYFQSINEMGED